MSLSLLKLSFLQCCESRSESDWIRNLFIDLNPKLFVSDPNLAKMKKKQSAGVDGLSQDKLVLGSKALVYPLVQIINQSIREGAFPSQWKEALVTPVTFIWENKK